MVDVVKGEVLSCAGNNREVSIDKVENGYSVEAEFAVVSSCDISPCYTTRAFVFYTRSEMLKWVGEYFDG